MRTRSLADPVIGLALAVGLVLAITPAVAAAPSHAWTRQFGSAGYDEAGASVVDATGNMYVAGYTDGTLPGQIARGNGDAYLRKYRSSGTVAWTRQFGTSKRDAASSIAIDRAGNVYVAGFTKGALRGRTNRGLEDAYVRKYRPNGTVAWTRQFGTAGDDGAAAIAVDGANRIYVGGYTSGTFPGQKNRGNSDAFVRKLRPGGQGVWTRQFGTSGAESVMAMTGNASGGVYVGGYTSGRFPGQKNRGNGDAFVRKLQPDGRGVWARQFGTAGPDYAYAIATDARGRIYVGGEAYGALPGKTAKGGYDAYVRKYRPGGQGAWTRQFGTASRDSVVAMTSDPAGRIYVAGRIGRTNGLYDAFARKIRPSGSVVWTRRIGTKAAHEVGAGISVDRRGNVFVVGSTGGTLIGQQSKGDLDAFIRKYRR